MLDGYGQIADLYRNSPWFDVSPIGINLIEIDDSKEYIALLGRDVNLDDVIRVKSKAKIYLVRNY